jgi:hypothetical protein
MATSRRERLYAQDTFEPRAAFNKAIVAWPRNTQKFSEHKPAAAFEPVREVLDKKLGDLLKVQSTRNAHKELLSSLTNILLTIDLSAHLGGRLQGELINSTGFRTALSQGSAKNNGENFVNAIVYSLAILLSKQDKILVDKGVPPLIRRSLEIFRKVPLTSLAEPLKINVPIECDFAIFSRDNPLDAIVISAKTRLKEVFHVGTMWKILFDMIGDEYCERKWGLVSRGSLNEMLYCFATADMIPTGGTNTQGPDVERDFPRNLIAMDASFFDYVFVSKSNISHVSTSLQASSPREALFHELGCIVDLIEQKFSIRLDKI